MAKFLLLLLAILLLIPRLLRLLLPRGPGPSRPSSEPEAKQDPEELRDLTRQEITDADYEEIPPEE